MEPRTAQRVRQLPQFLFMRTRQRVREARERGVDVITLGVGEPDEPTPAHVIDALCAAVGDPATHRYPEGETKGMLPLREAVADWYRRRFQVEVDPVTEVHGLLGSKEGNHHLSLGVLGPGDVAVAPDPGYPAYASSAVIAGADVVTVPLRAENDHLMDLDEVVTASAGRARLLWVSYPNNPTTAVAPLDFFENAVEFAHRHDVILVSDNPYCEITFDGVRAPSILEVDGAKEVAVEFTSLSKTYNMAGWRIGMAAGNAALIAAMGRVKETTDSGIFTAVQHAAVAALTGPQDVVHHNLEIYARRRDLVVGTLRQLGLDVTPPAGTFFVWAPVPAGATSESFATWLLDSCGVVVTPGSGFGTGGEGFVRLSLGVPDARLVEALHRIESAWHESAWWESAGNEAGTVPASPAPSVIS